MADILIRGMEMPQDCGTCFIGDRTMCSYNCPLRELPEHGDLIDRDYIQRTLKPYSKEDEQVEVTLGTAKRLIQNAINAPVIVPSNKEVSE